MKRVILQVDWRWRSMQMRSPYHVACMTQVDLERKKKKNKNGAKISVLDVNLKLHSYEPRYMRLKIKFNTIQARAKIRLVEDQSGNFLL